MEWVFNTFSGYLENDLKKRIGKLKPDHRGPLASLSGAFPCYVGAAARAGTGGQYSPV